MDDVSRRTSVRAGSVSPSSAAPASTEEGSAFPAEPRGFPEGTGSHEPMAGTEARLTNSMPDSEHERETSPYSCVDEGWDMPDDLGATMIGPPPVPEEDEFGVDDATLVGRPSPEDFAVLNFSAPVPEPGAPTPALQAAASEVTSGRRTPTVDSIVQFSLGTEASAAFPDLDVATAEFPPLEKPNEVDTTLKMSFAKGSTVALKAGVEDTEVPEDGFLRATTMIAAAPPMPRRYRPTSDNLDAMSPEQADAQFDQAIALLENERHGAAVRLFQGLERAFPKNNIFKKYRHYATGMHKRAAGAPEAAAAEFKKALSYDPNFKEAQAALSTKAGRKKGGFMKRLFR